MEIWDESFWRYTDQTYNRHIRTLKNMLMSIYDDGKYLSVNDADKEFLRTIFYALVLGYVTGSFAAYVKLNKYNDILLKWSDYRPEQWAYLEEFVEKNFDSLFWGLPSPKKLKAINDIVAFLPSSSTLDAMLWYAQYFTNSMSEKLHLGVSDRNVEGRKAFASFAYLIASSELVRAFQWGLINASYKNNDVVGFLFVAIIDEKTSRFCKPRHLMYIPREDKQKVIRNSPPLHPHCRSVLEPVTQKIGLEKNDLMMPQPPYYSPNEHIISLLM